MVDLKTNKKLDSNAIAEFDRYFSPNSYVVSKLPKEKDARDGTEVFIKNSSDAYDAYKMIKGKWVLINSNLNTVEKVVVTGSGGSGVDYSGDITNLEDRATALEARVHDYTKQTTDYTLTTAVGKENYSISVKNTGNTTITVSPNGSETIDNESSQDLGPDDCMTVMSDGSNWIIV